MSKLTNKLVSMVPGRELLHNRGVLYALCIVALLQIVMYGNVRDYNSVITFVIIGFLVSFFSKNMIIVLGTAIVLTYMLNYVPYKMISEGAENMKEDSESTSKDSTEIVTNNPKQDNAEAAMASIKNGEASSAESATAPSPQEKKKMLYDSLQNDFKEFEKIQSSILKGMQEIDPLLAKAESFIEKFEHYNKLATNGEAA